MSPVSNRYLIAIALSYGATIALYEAVLGCAEVKRLDRLLTGLAALGHVASFAIDPAGPLMDQSAVIGVLRNRWDFVVDAVLTADEPATEPAPAFLMPMWPFDHELEGRPASTARFLHLDLEVIATPTADEELGVSLPMRAGRWLVHARPLLF